ncbi:hypothetical protein GCM10007932_19950 [Vibrio penaeicida]|uniref:Uncharacterized protein n=1 Tax=Vibrio penaeicida TaxID=104609 RepID=A0AAV5NQC8_9VIBR|nr:hypothetical protein GCM10007932_19950 [Vibrio penaeicida]
MSLAVRDDAEASPKKGRAMIRISSQRFMLSPKPKLYEHDDIFWINDALRKIKLPDDLQLSE